LKQVALGDGVVRVEILRASEILVRHAVDVPRFQVGSAQHRIIRAADGEQRLPCMYMFARHSQNPADWPANLRDHGSSLEGVERNISGEPQHASQFCRLNRYHLNVRHLILRDREHFRRLRLRLLRRKRSHFAGAIF
jgi:hypothetical protein